MNTKTSFIAAILAGCSVCHVTTGHAQETDAALAHIKYEFVHIDDTNFRDNPRKEEMMVYIGQHASMYSSYTLAVTLEDMKKKFDENQRAVAARQGTVNNSFFISSPNITNETLYLFPQENKAFITDRIGSSSYIITQEYPQIDWQIGEETKEIGGYSCQQATGTFAGRHYTAWFTTELPFPYGPWKLQGLPGLILEAEDSKKEVRFHYAGFDKQEGSGIEIDLPKDAVTTTTKEFAKAKTAFNKNPIANAMRNMNVPPNANVERKIVLKDQSGREMTPEEFNAMREMAMKDGKIKNPNNPLELEDGGQ